MPNKLQTAQAVLLSSAAGMALLLAAPAPALADSLTPDTFSGTVGVGGVIDITDKVGRSARARPTTALADVMFLVDTTGSMGSAIGNVKTALSGTVSALSAFGSIATGAGQYKDATNSPSDGFDYELNQAITTNSALTQTAIDGFSASGGGDTPEQGLFALTQRPPIRPPDGAQGRRKSKSLLATRRLIASPITRSPRAALASAARRRRSQAALSP